MTTIKVEFLSYLAKQVGTRSIDLDLDGTSNVTSILERLKDVFKERFIDNFLDSDARLKENIVMLINGRNFKQFSAEFPDPMAITLEDGDEVVFIVPFGGG